MPCEIFFLADSFSPGYVLDCLNWSRSRGAMRHVVGLKVFGKSLSRLETLQSTPPFLQLYFFKRLILEENWLKSRIMLGKAFCGNGFIHLNIAEIHEGDIGGQKKRLPISDRGSKWAIFGLRTESAAKLLKSI